MEQVLYICTGSEAERKTNLECDEADENAQDEEEEGDDEPDDAPHFSELLASQRNNKEV